MWALRSSRYYHVKSSISGSDTERHPAKRQFTVAIEMGSRLRVSPYSQFKVFDGYRTCRCCSAVNNICEEMKKNYREH